MAYLFSPSTLGFYTRAAHGRAIPDDAVKVSAARHRELMDAQATGGRIVADAKGRPAIAAVTDDARRAQLVAETRREARRRIERISPVWRQMNDTRQPSAAGDARFAAIDAIRAASDAVEAAIADSSGPGLLTFDIARHPAWPE